MDYEIHERGVGSNREARYCRGEKTLCTVRHQGRESGGWSIRFGEMYMRGGPTMADTKLLVEAMLLVDELPTMEEVNKRALRLQTEVARRYAMGMYRTALYDAVSDFLEGNVDDDRRLEIEVMMEKIHLVDPTPHMIPHEKRWFTQVDVIKL